MPRRHPTEFARMTRAQLIDYCRVLYRQKGISALAYPQLSRKRGLYSALYSRGLPQKELIRLIGVQDEFVDHKLRTWTYRKGGKILKRWTWVRIKSEVRKAVRTVGFLPPASWFIENYCCPRLHSFGVAPHLLMSIEVSRNASLLESEWMRRRGGLQAQW